MPHPKMRESIVISPENTALAEGICACMSKSQGRRACFDDAGDIHWKDCPANLRPAVASALQSKDDSTALEIAELKAENKGCEEEIEQLNAQLQDCSAELRDSDRDKALALAEITRLKGEIGRLKVELVEAQSEIAARRVGWHKTAFGDGWVFAKQDAITAGHRVSGAGGWTCHAETWTELCKGMGIQLS